VTPGARRPDVDLDDLNALAELDSQDVLGAVERFGDQCREGWEIGAGAQGLPDAEGIDSVVVLGMGGSGVSGDVTAAIVEPRLPFPLRTIKTYGPLPEWIGRNTLVFAVSYSGSTEETIAAVEEAISRGARVVTISSGGPLAELARKNGLAHVAIPSGLQPRASLGYLAMPILGVLVRIGLVPDPRGDIEDAVELLRELGDLCHRKVPAEENPAKYLALKMI
jgi:glucose/mannose-6-phosphate isomerase